MTPTQTSIESYKLTLPSLGKRQQQVLSVFQRYPQFKFSDRDLSKITRLPINVVTPRRGEIALKGLIEQAGFIFDAETKRRVQAWRLK